SIQEVALASYGTSSFFDGIEWQLHSEEYPVDRSESDSQSPPIYELEGHIAGVRNEKLFNDRARLGIVAAETVGWLFSDAGAHGALWDLVRFVHTRDYGEIDPILGHDAVVRAALGWATSIIPR